MTRPFLLSLYGAALSALSPLAGPVFRARAAKGKEDRARIGERMGRTDIARPDGPLVWLHGASVGETRVNLALAGALAAARPGLNLLLTTQTRTAAQIVQRDAPPGAIHQFVPLDAPAPARRFLDHWRPDLAVFAESELWPSLIAGAAARGIPLALANARMSASSLRGWARFPRCAAWLLSRFSWIGAGDTATAGGLAGLSGRAVAFTGNVKLDAPQPAYDTAALAALKEAIGARMTWCAASTHEGEEETILEAHRALRFGAPDALLILCPRHPERGDAVEATIRTAGMTSARRSRGEAPGADTDVYLADTIGEMGVLLRAAPVVLLGGALVPGIGGHNPAEPVRAGAALMSGPHTHNFADVFSALAERGGAAVVEEEGQIAQTCAGLLANPERRAAMRRAAETVLYESAGATARTVEALTGLLDGAGQ
mgnify:CR=1 FL=1